MVFRLLLAITVVLLAPLIAMQFTDEVNWSLSDFIAGGVLLFGAGLVYLFVAKLLAKAAYRLTVAILIGVVTILVWVELAVGIFGSPLAGS